MFLVKIKKNIFVLNIFPTDYEQKIYRFKKNDKIVRKCCRIKTDDNSSSQPGSYVQIFIKTDLNILVKIKKMVPIKKKFSNFFECKICWYSLCICCSM